MDTKSVLVGMAGGIACAVAADRLRKKRSRRAALPRAQQTPQVQVEILGEDGEFHPIPTQTMRPKRRVPPAVSAYLQQVVAHGANSLSKRVMDGVAALFEPEPDPYSGEDVT